MARGDTAARQIRLWMLLLQRSDLSVEQAAEQLDCNVRTIYRDLDGLERAGIPLYQDQKGRGVRWKLVEGANRKLSVQLTVHEAMALVAAEGFLSAMQGSVFDHASRNALAKVKHALAPEIRMRVEALSRHLSATSAPPRKLTKHRDHLDVLLEVTEKSQVVVLEYRKLEAKELARYTLELHHIHVQGSGVYLVGWVRERSGARVFLLDRVETVTPLKETFVRRPEIGPGLFAQGSFGLWDGPPVHVALLFSGSAAQIVAEQEFHPTQKQQRHLDGSLTLEMDLPLCPSLRAWVRGFGDRVTVLEPARLINEP